MFDISMACRLVSVIVRPRPSLRVLRQGQPALPRSPYPYNGQARRTLQRDSYYVEPSKETDVKITTFTEVTRDYAGSEYSSDLPVVEEECRDIVSEDSSSDSYGCSSSYTSTTSGNGSYRYASSVEPGSPRVLRSCRRRKCKSVGDVEEAFLKIKDGGEQNYRSSHTWPRTNRSLSWILASGSDHTDNLSFPMEEHPDTSFGDRSREIWRIKDPLQRFSDPRIWQMSPPDNENSGATDQTQYYTALTSFPDTATSCEESQILQAVHRESGALFQRVCHSDGGDIQRFDHLQDAYSNDLVYQLVPTRWVSQINAFPPPPGSILPQQPSLVLTVPTPMVPQSPVFAPQSPITVSKFFSALNQDSNEAGPTFSGSITTAPLPSLPSCGECGLIEFEMGTQCRACNQRWLSCKVWYRAQDGGRRRWLTEPYIRPAESNARNRAIMHGLGVPGCEPSDLGPRRGLGHPGAVNIERSSKPRRNRLQLRRAWRLFKTQPIQMQDNAANPGLAASGKNEPSPGLRAVRPLRVIVEFSKTLAMLSLSFLWVVFVKSWSYDVCVPFEGAAGGVEMSENAQAALSHDAPPDCLTQFLDFGSGRAGASPHQFQGTTTGASPPRLPQQQQQDTAHSRFVEHLMNTATTAMTAGRAV